MNIALVQPDSSVGYALTSGRLVPTVVALIALAGVVVGGLALARPGGRFGQSRTAANAALTAGLVSVAGGGVWAATTAGTGFGTGNGFAGALVAVMLGLVSLALGGLVRARARNGHRAGSA
ncbi:DUF6223 family protein [Nonomuraea sp. 10N515B]|uniref:DUF6223 family protein n=1 Tax=Nonomuraea sp. 10N515B TaxID=3457422 RepID=UPI003FCE0524